MVKNKTGGSRHKKQARKNVNAPVSSKLRLANEEGEIYAKVIKLCGNGMADVLCNDKVVRLLIIRKKFKGRHKRDNTIAANTLLLVGRRLWEVVAEKKKQKVDLLCVYSMSQIEQLKKRATINIDLLPKHVQIEDDCGGFEITSKHDWKNELQQMEATNTKVSNTNTKILVTLTLITLTLRFITLTLVPHWHLQHWPHWRRQNDPNKKFKS